MLQAQAAQQLALAQQGSGALSGGVQQPQHGGAPNASMAAAADRAHSGALPPPLDDAALRSAAGGGGMAQQQALSGGGMGGGRRTSQECGSPAPFGATASPSHSGTGNTRRGGFQGDHQTHLGLRASGPCGRTDASHVRGCLWETASWTDSCRDQAVVVLDEHRKLLVDRALVCPTTHLSGAHCRLWGHRGINNAHRHSAGEPEVSSLGPGGSGGGPGSVTSGGGPSEANAGPRIFVGKLTKGTTEEDVKQYFTRCVCFLLRENHCSQGTGGLTDYLGAHSNASTSKRCRHSVGL